MDKFVRGFDFRRYNSLRKENSPLLDLLNSHIYKESLLKKYSARLLLLLNPELWLIQVSCQQGRFDLNDGKINYFHAVA